MSCMCDTRPGMQAVPSLPVIYIEDWQGISTSDHYTVHMKDIQTYPFPQLALLSIPLCKILGVIV